MKKAKKQNDFDFRTIKTFEDACKKLNIDPTIDPIGEEVAKEFHFALMAVYQLFIIFKAINDGWTPDWSNASEFKYYPWYWMKKLSSGFGFSGSVCGYSDSGTLVGSRLCTNSSEKALYIAEQFKDLYEDFFLIKS